MTKSDKVRIVEQLSLEFGSCDSIVICEYKGLTVNKLESLRSLAREHNVKVKVVKNTLANIALNKANKQGLIFKDTNIFLWSNDQLAVSKVASKFAEKNDIFKIKTAHIDGCVVGVERIEALSKLPSRNELIAMLLQVWNAPLQNFVIGLNALKNKKEE